MKTATRYGVWATPADAEGITWLFLADNAGEATATGERLATTARKDGFVALEAQEIRSERLQLFVPQEMVGSEQDFHQKAGYGFKTPFTEVPAGDRLQQMDLDIAPNSGMCTRSTPHHEAGSFFGVRVWRGNRGNTSATFLFDSAPEAMAYAADYAARFTGGENPVSAIETLRFEAKSLAKWVDKAPQLSREGYALTL